MLNADAEGLSWLRFVIAATTVLGLMGLLAWGLKYVMARGWVVPMSAQSRRLKVVESLPIDARRRLVIVRCDEAEHLLLLGVNQDMMITQNLPKPPATPDNATNPA